MSTVFVLDFEDLWLNSATSKAAQLVVEIVVWLLFKTVVCGKPTCAWITFLILQGDSNKRQANPKTDSISFRLFVSNVSFIATKIGFKQ
ncbi:MAG: hypothetical protein ACK5M1_00200 [Xanthomarina gelatinilytica]|uniref:hypothetical protein n=1 Tax=Xanthomarina gelatinilytica TaxID=1137281 RepID=UPI003A861A7C